MQGPSPLRPNLGLKLTARTLARLRVEAPLVSLISGVLGSIFASLQVMRGRYPRWERIWTQKAP
jgi:hypothetical protein